MARPAWVAPGGPNHPFNVPIDPAVGSYWYGSWKAGMQYPASFTGTGVIDPYGNIGLNYASFLYNYGVGTGNQPGDFNCRGVNFTFPLYYTEDADDTYTIIGGNSAINGTTIPFKSTWKSADPQLASQAEVATGGPLGSDAQMIVVTKATGKEWNLWRVFVDTTNKKVYVNTGSVVGTEININVPGNATANIYTKENGWQPSRGIGINLLMGLVVPEEITAQEITHALCMPSSSIAKTFYLHPATKLEHPASTEPNSHPIPEGARFYLDESNTNINGVVGFNSPEEAMDAFIAWKHPNRSTEIKTFIKTVGVALFKYGWFISDTSGAAGWQFESTRSAGTLWTALGIDFTSGVIINCMDGLITPPIYDSVNAEWTLGNLVMSTTSDHYLMAATNTDDITEQNLIWTQGQSISS